MSEHAQSERARNAIRVVACVIIVVAACSSRAPGPAVLDVRNDACAHCRMSVSDAKFAAQLVAPGEEPKFFDDVGCLREYLKGASSLAPGSVAYVASHRTGAWVPASGAVYVYAEAIETPMGFHLLAFENAGDRDADPAAAGAERIDAAAVFGGRLPAGRP